MSALHFRWIARVMLRDLIAQKSMHRLLRPSVRRHDAHDASLRQVLVAIRDQVFVRLHLVYTGWHLSVGLEGLVERSPREIGGDGSQVAANGRDHGFVLLVLDSDLDGTACRRQLEVMR